MFHGGSGRTRDRRNERSRVGRHQYARFTLRQMAEKNILDQMTEEVTNDLRGEAERMASVRATVGSGAGD